MEHAKQEELKERTELEQAGQEKLIRETYECLKNTDIRTVDPSSVTDIRDIQVDLSLSVEQRLVSVIQQMNGNPFVYRCEDILVKITFGCVRHRFEPQPSENPESLGTLRLTELPKPPVTGQKSALTTCLTTIGKFHNRV